MGIMMVFESSPETDLHMLRNILAECGAVPLVMRLLTSKIQICIVSSRIHPSSLRLIFWG